MTRVLTRWKWPASLAAAAVFAAPALGGEVSTERARTTLETYCRTCHSGESALGGFDVSGFRDKSSLLGDPEQWQTALTRVRSGEMPPGGAPEPPPEERDALAAWIGLSLREAACSAELPPEANAIRRLNRDEYAATVRDLLHIHFNAGGRLPADGAGGEGFDNAAETLFLSPVHGEKYLEAAQEALDYALSDSKARQRLLIAEPGDTTSPEEAARRNLEAFLPRAFRRPVRPDELTPYLSLFRKAFKKGESFEGAMLLALRAVMVSPRFLYRIEKPNPNPLPRPVDDFELATRLSYFLWGSMPGEELFQLAAEGKLSSPEQREATVLRMLADERTRTFSERFVEQWLGIRELGRDIVPDPNLFPEYHNRVFQAAIRYEPILFFDEIISKGLSLENLLDSDFSVINKRLARHYGLEEIEGLRENPEPVELPEGSRRGGLLTMASVLAVSSYPNRTSPVLRGVWVLERLLGAPPPAPPPDVPELEENRAGEAPRTLRARLEKHRADATCASCHDRIDPIGFGLENFDVLGRWREQDEGAPIDARGVLPGGAEFEGPEGLKAVLLERRDEVVRNVTRKLLGYALGRGLTFADTCTVDRIVAAVTEAGYNAHTLILEIVNSEPFRMKPGPANHELARNR